MSAQYDIFDNLNSFLDKADDCDVPDDAELGASFDEAETDMAAVKSKPLPKRKTSAQDPQPISPKKRRKRAKAGSQQSSSSQSSSLDTTEDGLSSGPSSSSLSSGTSRSAAAPPVVITVPADDLNHQFQTLQQQYNLIFAGQSAFTPNRKRYFDGLKRQYNALLKQRSGIAAARSARRDSFQARLSSLKDVFYDICINSNLLAPRPAAPQPQVTAAASRNVTSPGTRRRRREQAPEVINLVDSPALILPGVVNLDSDDEDSGAIAKSNLTANLSFDAENYEMSLKVRWGGKIDRFAHRKFQKFADLIELLAKREGADPRRVVLDLNEKIIKPDDTPDSIGYRISQFIGGRVVEGALGDVFTGRATSSGRAKKTAKKNTNLLTLQVQSDRWKHPFEVQIEKDRQMKLVVIKCAEQLKCSPADIRLSFDGDSLDLDATPAELELEGGEMLDLRFIK